MKEGDQLGFVISQPLRVENGSMQIVTPVGHNYRTGQSQFNTAWTSLSPTGQEIDMELSYGWKIGNLALGASAILQRNPGHNDQIKTAVATMVTANIKF